MTLDGISVVIPCYNASLYIRQSIESALKQDVDCPVEILVCDDGSTDDSHDIISSMKGHVSLFMHPGRVNKGLVPSRNLCIQHAQYPYIAFLDADDEWLPNHLLILLNSFRADPSLGMAVNNGLRKCGNREGGELIDWPTPRPLTAEDVLLNTWFPPSGVMVRKDFLIEVGGFDENCYKAEDYDLWLKFLEKFPGRYTAKTAYYYRFHSAQLSLKRQIWEGSEEIMLRAAVRGHYSRRVIRKRKAVINYHYSQHSSREGNQIRAAWELFKAFCYDPIRAIAQLFKILAGTHKRT